jgi:hypothetical protein
LILGFVEAEEVLVELGRLQHRAFGPEFLEDGVKHKFIATVKLAGASLVSSANA